METQAIIMCVCVCVCVCVDVFICHMFVVLSVFVHVVDTHNDIIMSDKMCGI